MAPVIWGLDLKEMQWGKFKGSYMFNKIYHLRRTKMIVYQMAMIFMVVSESIGTDALSEYVDQQEGIQGRSNLAAHVHNNDIIGVFSYNIFVGIAVATIFGSGFFFDLFWPERKESNSVRLAWRICSVIMCFMTLADAIAVTVIVARNEAYITPRNLQNFYFTADPKPNHIYRKNAECVASTVILWLGMLSTWGSTYVMWKSLQHDEQFGPFSAEGKMQLDGAGDEENAVPASRGTELKPVTPANGTDGTNGTSGANGTHGTLPSSGLDGADHSTGLINGVDYRTREGENQA